MTPKLRFPEFNGEWHSHQLGDIAQLKSGNTPSKADSSLWGGDINWVSASSMHSDVIYDSEMKLTEEGLKYAKTFPRNTIVILIRGSMLWNRIPICRLGEKAAINQDVKSIVVTSEGLETDYLYFWLKAKEPKLKQAVIGTGIGAGKIETEFLYNLPIRIPNRTHQKRLINLFKAVDQKINLLTKKKEALETYKKGLMQKIFSQELRFKREDGTDYPEWETYCIVDLGEFFNGLTGKNSSHFGHGNSQYVQYSQVFRNSYIKLDECDNVDVEDSEKQNALKVGDALFTTSSEVADEVAFASILLNKPEIDTYLNSFCFGLRLNSLLAPSFAQYLFRTNIFRKAVYPLAQGSTRYNVSKKEVGKVKLLIPSVEEQNHIAKSFRILDSKIEQLIHLKKKTEQLKKGLLQQMFV